MPPVRLSLEQFAPCFLVAAPQLRDPHFYRTVIVLVDYRAIGAQGLVINRPLNVPMTSVHTESPRGTEAIASHYHGDFLWSGGPVKPDLLVCLYEVAGQPINGDAGLGMGLAIAKARALLATAADRARFPGAYRIFAGHAAWQPKQLDAEILAGTWLVTPLQSDMIFTDQPDGVWQRAIHLLGIDPVHYHDTPSGIAH